MLGYKKTGLDVIEELNISSFACLVTSRYEDLSIRNRCEKLNIRIIPKSFAEYISIKCAENKQFDAILIDDDPMMHMIWQMSSKQAGKNLGVYFTFDNFMQDIDCLDISTPIYIDANLKDGVCGDVVSESIYNYGFKEIYLTTGYDKERFSSLPWIKDVIGKYPPWEKIN